jgi:hypothetical protein
VAQFLVSTDGYEVAVDDLGLIFGHPTVDRDLSQELRPEDIAASEDLTAAIQDGYLILKLETSDFGLFVVDPSEYNSFSLLDQLTPDVEEKEEFVTESEIFATNNDSVIRDSIFPADLSSTTAVTNVVTANNAAFQNWRVAPNDIIGLAGTGTTDGYFTVESVTSQTQLVTVEALLTTNGVGTFSIFHPPGASRVGVNNIPFTAVSGTNVQAALESIETNTASNVGVGGVGLFKQKDGYDLQFKNINAGSAKITVTDDVANDEVDIDVDPSAIDHQSLSGAGTYTHAAIDNHIDGYANPHNVTAQQVGNATAQWNANQLQSIPIDVTAPGDGYMLRYDGYQWTSIDYDGYHRALDQLVHDIAEDSYDEITYVGNNVTSIIVWTDSGQTQKIREEQFTYLGTQIQTATIIQYGPSGQEVERMTEAYNYSGNRIVSIDRELV